jgi:hypothetical protein
VEILILKVISAPENSNKSQKPGFGRKISRERGNTWANGTGHTSSFLLMKNCVAIN